MDITDIIKRIESIDADDATKAQLKEHVFLYKQADSAFGEDRYEDGISILHMLLKRVPDDINAKTMLAIAYDSAGYPVKAIRLWEEICEIEHDIGEYSLALALAYRRQGWMQKAIKQLKTTVDLIPDNRMAWEQLVECSIETEDTHEAMMNCFGAMHVLKEHGIESIRLNAFAFSFTVLGDNDRADRYLTTIIDMMRNGEKHKQGYYEDAIHSILWKIDMAECYEFLPRIKEMADTLSDISEWLAKYIVKVKTNAEIAAIDKTFPEVISSLIELRNSDCDCEECRRETVSLECSILSDPDGYNPELI